MGVTRDQLDALDLTDNSITSLSNFPLLRRLQHIYLSSNPVRTISSSVPTSLPNLRTLILTNSAIPKDSLAQVGDVLARCKRLETLSFKGSPVAEAQYYREWIIFKCRHLRSLDFDRIRDKVRSPLPPSLSLPFHTFPRLLPHLPLSSLLPASNPSPPRPTPPQDRKLARSLFVTPEGTPTPLASALASASQATTAAGARTFEPGEDVSTAAVVASGKAGRLLTKEEKERVRSAIEGAESVEEVRSSLLLLLGIRGKRPRREADWVGGMRCAVSRFGGCSGCSLKGLCESRIVSALAWLAE